MNTNQPIPINTTITETPQLQTVVQDGVTPVTTLVNAPWVSVTSVNGKTGDVAITAEVSEYQSGIAYKKGDIVLRNNELYYSLTDFVAGPFNASQWKSFSALSQQQANWTETNQSLPSYIQNKPTKVSTFTNDAGYVTSSTVDSKISTAVSTATNNITKDVDAKITAVDNAKVDKVSGFGLSENNFTNTDKTKLSSLADIHNIGSGLSLSTDGLLSVTPTTTDKLYNVSFVSSTGYTLNDTSFSPTLGSHIFIRTNAAASSSYAKLSVNGSTYLPIQSPPIGTSATAQNVALAANCVYELIYLSTYWQCLNAHPLIGSSSLASSSVGGNAINWTDIKNQVYFWDNDVTQYMGSWNSATMTSTTVTGLEVAANYYYIAQVQWIQCPGDAEIIVSVNNNNSGSYFPGTNGGLGSVTVVGEFYSGSTVTVAKKYNGTAGTVRFGPVKILFLRASY